MKSITALLATLATAAVATTPGTYVALAALVDSNEISSLIVRDNCELDDSVVSAIGTSTSLRVYVTAGGGLALSVCNILHNLGVGGIGTAGCYNIAGAVSASIAIIFTAVGEYSQSAPEEDTKRDVLTLESRLNSALAQHGIQYDSISTTLAQNTDNKMPMLDHAVISGFRHGNTTFDLTFADFGEGNGHVRVGAPASQSASLAKRQHNGPGFKISYTSRRKSLLTTAHQQQASSSIALDWAARANSAGISDYIGLQKTDHNSNFYFIIIPETNGYGLNYESVNLCGQLGGFL